MTIERTMTGEDRLLLDELNATFGDLSSLSAVQRILLTTDGTVTHVLEAFAGEPVNVVKLSQSYELSLADDPETFRELVSWGVEPAGEVGRHFGLEEKDRLISRTYRMLSRGQPIMVITEKFPVTAFRSL